MAGSKLVALLSIDAGFCRLQARMNEPGLDARSAQTPLVARPETGQWPKPEDGARSRQAIRRVVLNPPCIPELSSDIHTLGAPRQPPRSQKQHLIGVPGTQRLGGPLGQQLHLASPSCSVTVTEAGHDACVLLDGSSGAVSRETCTLVKGPLSF